MLLKNHQNETRNLLATLKKASKDNREIVILQKKNFYYKPVLKILHNKGFIQSFEEKKDFIIVRLKQTFWKARLTPVKALLDISNISRVSKKFAVKYKKIVQKFNKKGEAFVHIFGTDRGLVTDKELANLGRGGFPLIKVV